MNKLSVAIENSDLKTVKNLIEVEGYSPEYTGHFWLFDTSARPIVMAAHYNQPEIMNYLIEKGANVNQVLFTDTVPPIKHALQFQHVPVVSILLANHAMLPYGTNKTELIKEYLLKAFYTNDTASFERLLTCSKIDINSPEFGDNNDMSLLDLATHSSLAPDMVSKLIELGAKINIADNDGLSPLDTMIINNNSGATLSATTALHSAEISKPNIEPIEPIKINEVLTLITDKGSFASDVINHDNHSLFSLNDTQLAQVQVSTYIPEINTALNQTIEQQEQVFGA